MDGDLGRGLAGADASTAPPSTDPTTDTKGLERVGSETPILQRVIPVR